MISTKKIAVVIPSYKVSKQLKNVLLSIPEFVDDIIVVDDACPEKSGTIAKNVSKYNIHVIEHDQNQGVGGAMISGYKKAMSLQSNIIVKLDGDGQMDPKHIATLIQPILDDKADYTKGNRFHDFEALKAMPKTRLFGNSSLSFIIKAASGYWHMMDPTNGFCAISRKALQSINLEKIEKRYFFETDMLIHLNLANKVVEDVPISAIYNDEKSNLSIRKVLFSFPFKIVKRFIKRVFFKYYIYNFNMASIYMLIAIPLLLFGFTFGMYRWTIGILENTENTAGTIMLVALPIILGVQFLLQAVSIDIHSVPKKR
ncbi:glycosyltransferase family 2 protein [Flavobacteriaceae bacterium S356]|uniref:Glycosyltransferase family 2 protein n=1 Tax=Asprobacillus argus TaxID=3076534 RepID=A0ABU3LDJ1_9FLAO|nr:glycosyltransferase family 2 protein [Flavobacteriaceae bacterium S356]